MTVSNTTSVVQYNGNGATVAWPTGFRFFKSTDLVVTKRSAAGVTTLLTLNIDYSVVGANGLVGGTVTTTNALAVGELLTIARVLTVQQLTDLRNQGNYFAEIHEDVFDYLTMLIQQTGESDSRALRHPRDSEHYQAEARRIVDLEDPVDSQDAATKRWAEIYVGSVISGAQGPINVAANVAYIFPDGTVHTVQDLSNKVMASLGLNGIGYRGRTAAEAFQGLGVSPEDYGAINDFSTDSTTAIMAAFNAAKTLKRPLIWSGNWAATQLQFDNPSGVTIIGGGTLTALSNSAQESVLTLKNYADFRLNGRLVVSAAFKTNYAAGVAIYTDNGTGASQFDISGLTVVGAQVGVRIGRRTEPDALLSEGTFFGGNFYGCPTCFELIGTQTVMNFVGVNMITGTNGGSGAWLTLPRSAVRSFGASYTITGGESLIVDVTTGILFDNRPIASTLVGNRYGNASINNNTIECASRICLFWNPENIPSLTASTGSVRMINCDGYHSQDSLPIIQTYDDFTGSITAIANPLFCNVTRTVSNISVGLAACDIYVDDNSFGKGFLRGLSAVAGGRVHFTYREIMRVENFNTQSLPIGLTDLRPITGITTGDLARAFISYNSSTGVFTTLQSFRTLRVDAQIQTAGLTTGDTYIIMGSTNVGITSNNRLIQVGRTLNEVPAGSTFKVQVNNVGSSSQTALPGSSGFIQFSAANI